MKVQDIMSKEVSFVAPSASVVEIANIMKQKDIGSVPVCENGMVLGIITDRDIVLRVIAAGKDVNQTKADQIMTADPVCVEEDASVQQASQLMSQYQVKRLPVVSNGKLVGIIALGDLAIEHIHMNEAGEALSGISRGISH